MSASVSITITYFIQYLYLLFTEIDTWTFHSNLYKKYISVYSIVILKNTKKRKTNYTKYAQGLWLWCLAPLSTILESFISWRSVLLVKETGVHRENHRPTASHWQTLSHNVVSSTPRYQRDSNSQEEFEDAKGAIRNRISKKNSQWSKEKTQKDNQWSTKHTYKTKDRVTKTGDELRCSERVSSTCSTSGTLYKPGEKSRMRKGPGSVYDKWNISVVIYDTDIP